MIHYWIGFAVGIFAGYFLGRVHELKNSIKDLQEIRERLDVIKREAKIYYLNKEGHQKGK